MNVKDSIKKVGAVAASTLMVGMTMGAAQSLSEFPGMFVDDEGSPTAQVVVGSQGAVSDVVGAVNVAAALGQATIQTSEMTETVDVETSGGIGWSVDGDGQTLDTRNDNLFFGDSLDEVRDTLTEDHLDALQTMEFQDDAGNTQDVEFYLRPGNNDIQFGTSGENDVDPFLYVNNPTDPTDGDSLYELQANFQDGLEIAESDGTPNDDVLGEEVELFGKSFTISQDSFSSNNAGELILFGASEEYDLETGQSTEIELGGETATLEVRAVTDSETVAFYVNNELRERTEGSTVNVMGTDIRVDDVIQTSTDNSEGLATFSIGSEEYRVDVTGDTVQNSDENDIEGTYASATGSDGSSGLGSGTQVSTDGTGDAIEISSLTFQMGAVDDESDYIGVGESYEDPIFDGLAFSFGGLAPDAGEGAGDNVGEISFGTDGDDTVTASFSDGENDASLNWAYSPDVTIGSPTVNLADGDGETIHVVEGANVMEDQYFAADAGDFDHLWEVTGIDKDSDAGSMSSDDEATIDLRDAVTGAQVEVDLDADGSTDDYIGTEVIDGQTYHFHLDGATNGGFYATWGPNADATDSAWDTGDAVSTYSALDTESGASLALTKPEEVKVDYTNDADGTGDEETFDIDLPSTESTETNSVTISVTAIDASSNDDTDSFEVDIGDTGSVDFTADGDNEYDDFTVGQVVYNFEANDFSNPGDGSGDADVDFEVSVDSDQSTDGTGTGGVSGLGPTAFVLQSEDDDDQEHVYMHTPGVDDSNDEIDAGGGQASVMYTGNTNAGAGYNTATLDSDDDMEVAYSVYGTHTMQDTEDQGSFTLHVPDQQAVAGAAFHGPEASFSSGGTSTGSGEVTYTGVSNEDIRGALPDMAKTDDQVTQSDRQNSHLILVGGPAVNTLVGQLADDGETWTTDQWRNEHVDEALLQVVEDAFADGQHAMIVAGHSADDTRAAARYISEYASHQDTLSEAGMQYSPSSQEAPR